MHIKRTQWAVHKHSGYCLRTQREEFQRVEDEFVRNNDNKGLDEWRLQQHQSWGIQCKDGKQLMVYLNSATVSRLGELNDLKSERREQIHERLSALGREDQYLRFDRGNAERQWNLLVGVSKPLTDRTWTNMLPKLTQLLEENRAEIDKIHQRQHRCARILIAEDLLRQLRRDTHPYQSIINALQMEGPLIQTGFNSLEYRLILPTPFPDNRVIRGWDFFTNLYEEENSIERVEELFNERQETICQELLE
ncbi:unnamed protein product [Rhizoctonia solani]|uniref:Uncharacterized protein n=1 Tax=Rhizoctonia solani TaxID=456999 RepID=A0A8H3CAC3_9AGAM|nr:unnamed protein product [Rhizoctonia solani]